MDRIVANSVARVDGLKFCHYSGCPKPVGAVASYKCGKCKSIRYCSKKCQKKDWKNHKSYCQSSIIERGDVFDFLVVSNACSMRDDCPHTHKFSGEKLAVVFDTLGQAVKLCREYGHHKDKCPVCHKVINEEKPFGSSVSSVDEEEGEMYIHLLCGSEKCFDTLKHHKCTGTSPCKYPENIRLAKVDGERDGVRVRGVEIQVFHIGEITPVLFLLDHVNE